MTGFFAWVSNDKVAVVGVAAVAAAERRQHRRPRRRRKRRKRRRLTWAVAWTCSVAVRS